jgi:hypothetical protein
MLWWWFWMMSPSKHHDECDSAHTRVTRAARDVERAREDLKETTREARHGNRNIRMLLNHVLERLEKRNDR